MQNFALPAGPALEAARACIRATDEQTLDDMLAVTRIPAPGSGEAARGEWLCRRLRSCGLLPVTDSVGNVLATTSSAASDAREIAIMAHLDTVFPADTPLDVNRDGALLTGPGVSDNARGLAALLTLVRALSAAGWPNQLPLTFIGSVGEEGAGDLRGAKHYIKSRGQRTALFIALDGAGATRIIHAGVGSRRLRVRYLGPGGHSWSDFGAPNAIHAAARAVAALTALPLASQPRTSLTVGRIGGGTSVNAIPSEAWFELDLRSEAVAPLRALEEKVRAALEQAARAEHADPARLRCEVEVFGDRPAGSTAVNHPLVQLALAATRAIGLQPELASSSTDANVAMAAGIPAIAIGAGGDAGGTHTVREWYSNVDGTLGIERALLVVLGATGLTASQTTSEQRERTI